MAEYVHGKTVGKVQLSRPAAEYRLNGAIRENAADGVVGGVSYETQSRSINSNSIGPAKHRQSSNTISEAARLPSQGTYMSVGRNRADSHTISDIHNAAHVHSHAFRALKAGCCHGTIFDFGNSRPGQSRNLTIGGYFPNARVEMVSHIELSVWSDG